MVFFTSIFQGLFVRFRECVWCFFKNDTPPANQYSNGSQSITTKDGDFTWICLRVELGMGSPRTKWYLSSFFDFFGLPFLIGFSPWEFGGPTKKQGVSPLETSIFPRKTPRFYTSTCVAVACPTHSSGTDPPVWVLKPGRVGGSGDEVGEDVRHFLIKMAKNCENKWRWTLPCILYKPIDGFNFGWINSLESSLVIPVNRKSTSFGSIPTGSYQFLLDLVGSPGPTVKCSGDMARSREIVSQPPHFSGAICQL